MDGSLDSDYISPGLEVVSLDAAFPNMIIGTKSSNQWPYLRREIRHHWYVDRRNPTVGFLSRDEAMLLFNVAHQHFGKPCLEIGCWRGWSTAHMALGAGNLEVIDPVLANPEFREDVAQSLQRAGVRSSIVLHVGSSPDMVAQLSEETGKRWSLVFIDGDHEGDAPRRDAEVVHRYAGEDATILLHDLTSPHVATALVWLRDHGWTTAIYQTMQIMGVAVRGVAKPIAHLPDPRQPWTLPRHLTSFPVIGETRELRLHRIVADLEGQPPKPATESENSALDELSDVDARALDALLARAADSLGYQNEATTAFDELQAQYLRLVDRLAAREAEPDLSQEFAQLQAKHLEVLSRAADIECKLGAAQSESDAAVGRLRQEQKVARDLAVERDLFSKMFDRLQRKHVEVLWQLGELQERCSQTEVQAEEAQRASKAAAQALAAEREEARHASEAAAQALAAEREEARHASEAAAQVLAAEREEARRASETAAQALAAERSVELRAAIDRFASWMARKRILFGLSRRLLAGRVKEVRRLVEHRLRVSGVPDSLIPAAIWLARRRVVLGLVRRRALADMVSVQGHLVLSLERSFDISWAGSHLGVSRSAAAAALDIAELHRLRDQLGQLEGQLRASEERFTALEAAKNADENRLRGHQIELESLLRASQKRFAALEAAKFADEQALLEADLTIARLRKPQEAQFSR